MTIQCYDSVSAKETICDLCGGQGKFAVEIDYFSGVFCKDCVIKIVQKLLEGIIDNER